MKKFYASLLFLLFYTISFSQVTWQSGSNPEANQSATILFDKTGTGLATYSGIIYAHTGVTLNGTPWQNVLGSWGNNTTQPSLTLVSGNIYKLDLSPDILNYYSVTSGAVTKINIVLRSSTGGQQSVDLELNVGSFQSNLVTPIENSTTIVNVGQNITITANSTIASTFNLYRNNVLLNSNTGTSYSYPENTITSNNNYDLQITNGTTTFSKKFYVLVNPNTIIQSIPSGLVDGINYQVGNASIATLVLDAPGKDFVYVAGSFNNWQPDATYAMKKDPNSTKFWIELNGLMQNQNYTYQYWVVDQTPIANSPALVKTADPYSTLVLSPFDDPWIPAISYPNMPAYPTGQEREVTVLKTGQTTYPWSSATTNFVKPNKDNLVVYEVLIRDFDANRNFQDLINKIDYFKNLKVNAIELMPVMEYEGNESWGYNTAFHMALDKYYGTGDKLKEFVDLCHQNGIAVILDVALNHAFGRNPMVRMWMNDPDGDGWGGPSSENPYFNQIATHSYGVGDDFNHQQTRTKTYVKRVIKQWVEEFKIDGFRWDLTKGFTQNATGSDALTNAYQQDRVDVLKEYADYSWSLDPNHYVIFEHLGADNEEQQWANYRLGEGKGIMMWGELHEAYKQLEMGYATNADITRMGHVSRGFSGKRLLGYPESHDKDRLVYEAFTYGNGGGSFPTNGNLTNSIKRMSAIGAMSILVPGPKMIWHFGSLGMNLSLYTCNNGTVNNEVDAIPGNCKLDTKPQPQWTENWLSDTNRNKVYTDWARFIDMKKTLPVFNGDYAISPDGNNIRQRLYVYNNSLPTTDLKNVVILANFSVVAQNITPDFPYTGSWFNLMDNSTVNVTSTSAQINIPAGEFRIYGNKPALLNSENFQFDNYVTLQPNPASNYFTLSEQIKKVEIYSISGQLVKSFHNINSVEYQFNIEELKSGVYLVKVYDENAQTKTIKLIKR